MVTFKTLDMADSVRNEKLAQIYWKNKSFLPAHVVVRKVTVHHLPYEVTDVNVSFAIARYGCVLSVTRNELKGHLGIQDGSREINMVVYVNNVVKN